jgi:hypothetical protein
MRFTPQMVRAILNSPHRQELLDHFTAMGSHAYDAETDNFDYETYAREIFKRAQEYWGIMPQPIEAPKPPRNLTPGGVRRAL